MTRHVLRRLGPTAAVVIVWSGCASHPNAPASRVETPPVSDAIAADATIEPAASPGATLALGAVRERDWRFAGADGRLIETPHYRIHTTVANARLRDVIGGFMESALLHYRSALTPLPAPPRLVESYLLDDREQWRMKAEEVLGGRARSFDNLGRGGFATRGMAVLYDIGVRDTLSIAAHEGWHQYSQSTFVEPLPLCIEEGVATYMEGFRQGADGVRFQPWYNLERFGALRSAARDGRLIDLDDILDGSPESFLRDGGEQLLTYYAQVWALTHFLNEGNGGRYRSALRQLLDDAATGRMDRRLRTSAVLAEARRQGRGGVRAFSRGRAVVLEYFDPDDAAFEQRYLQFVSTVTARGGGYAVSRGRSPAARAEAESP